MGTKAYVLVDTVVGKTKEVAQTLRSLPGVEMVDVVAGPNDLIAVVEAPDLNAVGDLVTSQIHTINGVTRTVTCLVIERRG